MTSRPLPSRSEKPLVFRNTRNSKALSEA